MIGKICTFTSPFYNAITMQNEFKLRPALIVGKADSSDYNILPVSRVTNRFYLDIEYDIEVDPGKYPKLNLTDVSYIRTHKQSTYHSGALNKVLGDMKVEYPELYLDIVVKLDEYNIKLIDSAL